MATFLEIKELLKNILGIEMEMDEECDIILPNETDGRENVIIANDELLTAFNNLQTYGRDKLEMYTNTYREVALRLDTPIRMLSEIKSITDTTNGISYSIGSASFVYCLFLLNLIAEEVKNGDRSIRIDLRHRARLALRRPTVPDTNEHENILSQLLRVNTLKISTKDAQSINNLRSFASSFEFVYMYKKGVAISEHSDIQDIYSIGNSTFRRYREELDTPPQRTFNSAVLDYYTMALESRDPFTKYISFYHIVEHYFDAVFRKKLTDQIRERITNPDFSYKNENKIYDLAKFIKKHMNSDGESGKGDEFESLRYVLMEYVPIDELLNRMDNLGNKAKEYYQDNFVPFTTSKKTKISWSNLDGVYTNIATRIYETRNSLVHSKSEQIANQYKPYENTKDLLLEMPLIEAVAELVLINSSETI